MGGGAGGRGCFTTEMERQLLINPGIYMWPTFVREYLLRARTWSCTGLDHAVLVRPRDEARASLRSISACQYAHAFSVV